MLPRTISTCSLSVSIRFNLATLSNRRKCHLIGNTIGGAYLGINQIILGSDEWKVPSDNISRTMRIVQTN